MRTRICLFFGILLTLFYTSTSAQDIAGVPIKEVPGKFQSPNNSTSYRVEPNDGFLKGFPWIVYSDRPNNVTYTAPNSGQVKTRLGYLDPLFVIDYEGDFFHVASYAPAKIDYSKTPPGSLDKGWIKGENLLLWQHCLVSENYKMDQKGMILNTLASTSLKEASKMDHRVVKFTSDPNGQIPNGIESELYQILFIFKETDKYYLVGTENMFDQNDIKTILLGWVPKDRLFLWNTRVAIESNWDKKAASERKTAGVKAQFFESSQEAVDYKTAGKGEGWWSDDIYDKRRNAYYVRFPVLNYDQTNKIFNCGVPGEINLPKEFFKEYGKTSTISEAEIQAKTRELQLSLRNINVIFVIDGTQSMQDYFTSVGNAINNIMPSLKAQNTSNQFTYGVVVYRDYSEQQRQYKIIERSDDWTSTIKSLRMIQAKDSLDKDTPEAMYQGLFIGLTELINPQTTNLLILIGDAGNHRSDARYTIDQISSLLAKNFCHYIVYQVHHESHPSYDDFISQNENIMISAASNIYKNTIGQQGNAPLLVNDGMNIKRLKNSAFIGSVISSSPGQPISAGMLENEIEKMISINDEYITQIVGIFEQKLRGSGKVVEQTSAKSSSGSVTQRGLDSIYVSTFGPTLLNLLHKRNFSAEEIEYLNAERTQLMIYGYGPEFKDGLKFPLFRRTILFNTLELNTLINYLDELTRKQSNIDQRRAMVEAWKQILKKTIGDVNESEFSRLPLNEINEKVFGVALSDSCIIKSLKLESLADRNQINDENFFQYFASFRNSLNTLKKISEGDNPLQCFKSLRNKYYWIDENDLPRGIKQK